MAEHQRINREKTEELEQNIHKKRYQQQLYDQLKSPDEGTVGFQAEPSLEKHTALLANSHSDKQRASLVIQLQQSYGNAYVQRLLNSRAMQAKLTINPPDDEYEREADRVADAVTQPPASEVQRQPIEEEEEELMAKSSQVQRQEEEEEELMMKPVSEIQRQEEEEEEEELLQPKPAGTQPSMVSENLETRINDAIGSGQPLPDSVNTSLEPHFKHDFSQVRLHTDAEADKLSRKLEAEAFTTGKDIFFRNGAYQPDNDSGKRLIAHELTHVVQQKAAPALQREAVSSTTTETQAPTTEATAAIGGSSAERGRDEARLAAFRAMWDATVISAIRRAYEALLEDPPNVEGAVSSVAAVEPPLAAMRSAYEGIEPVYSRLGELYQSLARKHAELRPHLGTLRPVEEIRDAINPDAEPMAARLNSVQESL